MLRSDNAKEYFSAPFISSMSQHEILHQSSCAHTPQQNGVVERKNRHLVEIARTLLLHCHVPFHFWEDVVFTACYLINRMPSSVLHDQIPHSLLFPDQPLYFLPSRVFGCTCFVHILTPGQDKLFAKATKCIFLGYTDFRRVIVVIPLRLIDTFSLLMSPSLKTHPSSLPVFEVLPLPISPRLNSMLCLLDHFRFIIAVTMPLFLFLLLRSLLTYFLSLQLLLPRLLITYPLLFRKVIDLLVILIIFTIF